MYLRYDELHARPRSGPQRRRGGAGGRFHGRAISPDAYPSLPSSTVTIPKAADALPTPVALKVTSPDVRCVLNYVDPSGALVDLPVFRLTDD